MQTLHLNLVVYLLNLTQKKNWMNCLKIILICLVQILKSSLIKLENKSLEERYESVKKNYENFKNEGHLIQDSNPAFYIYEIDEHENKYCGIIAAVSVEDYKNNVIKKHENTIESREKYLNYLKTTGYNAELVLLTYKNSNTISSIIDELKNSKPTVEFSSRNKRKTPTLEKLKTIKN